MFFDHRLSLIRVFGINNTPNSESPENICRYIPKTHNKTQYVSKRRNLIRMKRWPFLQVLRVAENRNRPLTTPKMIETKTYKLDEQLTKQNNCMITYFAF